jgi:hypothetical protein
MKEKQLYASVRAGFIAKHTSLNKWCKENGIHRQNARDALLGIWAGDAGLAVRERLIEASGVDCRSSENLTATLSATEKSVSQFPTN